MWGCMHAFMWFFHVVLRRAGERRKRGKGDRRSQELSAVICAALEQTVLGNLLARSQINVCVQVSWHEWLGAPLVGAAPTCPRIQCDAPALNVQ